MAALAGLVPCALVGNEADVAVALAARLVIGADDKEAGVFALGAGVGLEGDAGETSDVGEPGLEVCEEFGVARASARTARRDEACRTRAR